MAQNIESFATGLSNALTQYLGLSVQEQMAQQKEQRATTAQIAKEGRELENQKTLKIFDMQLGDLRDMSKYERETFPISSFQGKGIEEADMLPGDARISMSDAIKFFNDRAKNKSDKAMAGLSSLRGEYFQQSKDYAKIGESTQRLIDAAKDPSAAGDLALIFNYMKILDPNSVVRESEFATAQNSAGVDERVRAAYNRVLEGERLAPETRKDFLNRGVELYRGQELLHRKRKATFKDTAIKQGFDPDTVALDIPAPNTFDTLEDAERANLPPGTYVIIGNQLAIVE